MDRCAPRADRLRRGRALAACLVLALTLGACGSASGNGGDGGGGGSNVDTDKVISEIQAVFGTSMISGSVDGTTINIKLVDGFGTAGAKLFMCSNVKTIMATDDPDGTMTVVMTEQSGDQLVTLADCK